MLLCEPMKLGTSVRFLFPTSPATHDRFRSLVAAMPKGAFIERPMGAYTSEEQARNLMEVAAAARAGGLDGLLTGDSHGGNPVYAASFSPLPTVARLMSVTGDMPIGVVLLAPFYHPVLLAEQIGTLAAFAEGPLIVTFVLGGRPPQFQAFGMEERSRVGRLATSRWRAPPSARCRASRSRSGLAGRWRPRPSAPGGSATPG